jgi:hypothetical protein
MEIYCRRLLKVIVVWRLYIQLLLNDLRNLTPMAEEQEAKQSKKIKIKIWPRADGDLHLWPRILNNAYNIQRLLLPSMPLTTVS